MRTPLALCLTTLFVSGRAAASIIYVDDSVIGGANDGSSWENAFLDLQDALAIAKAGDEIRVGQGVYKPAPPNGSREATFNLVGGTTLQGGYAGFGATDPDANDPEKFETILSGDLNGDDGPNFANDDENVLHIMTAQSLDETVRLKGLTVRAANAIVPGGKYEHSYGGGLRAENSNMDIVNCRFIANSAGYGSAGVSSSGGFVSVDACEFIGNRMVLSIGGAVGMGASQCTIRDSLFEGNVGGYWGGGASVGGVVERCRFVDNQAENAGGLSAYAATVVDCTFESNIGINWGGALRTGGESYVMNCRFLGNASSKLGGAVYNDGSLTMVNCLLSGNFTGETGSAVRSNQSATLINCSVTGNDIGFGDKHSGAVSASGQLTIHNSLIYDNTGEGDTQTQQLQVPANAQVLIRNSCVEGWTGSLGGVGNHGNDPNFVDADGPDNDYGTDDDNPRLRANSLCIDTGDLLLLPSDGLDLDHDQIFAEPLPVDLDFLPRVVGSNVDMGAFEFQDAPCRADIDGDGEVEVDDLITIILAWGPCVSGAPCPADLDLNMQVSVDDLIAVILGWGTCP